MPATVTAAGQLTASALVMTPVVLLVDRPWALAPPSARVGWALVALALVSTAAGYIVCFALLARAGATNVLLVTVLIPPSAMLLGALFLAERIAPRDLAGLACIAAGLACIAAGLAAIDGRFPRGVKRRLWPRSQAPQTERMARRPGEFRTKYGCPRSPVQR